MAHPSLIKSIGEKVLGHNGLVDLNDVCGPDRVIGLYFSAHWCPPCRVFTPQLVAFYNLKENTKHQLEVVLVSSDTEDTAFQDYFSDMPWLALPFTETKRKIRLSRQYRVTGIPTLVFIDSRSGRLLTKAGREMVTSDPEALTFPWRPRPIGDLLASTSLVDTQGQQVSYDTVKDSYKGLYFSAHWCPPCRAFTPQLVTAYEKINNKEHTFQIIFISSDRSEESWQTYHSTMPWLSMAWEEKDARHELASSLEVKGIPTLVILGPDNSIITIDGRTELSEDPEVERFPWRPQSVEVLAERHMSRLQESPCLVLFTDGETTELQFGRDVLLPVAEEYLLEHSLEGSLALQFFVAGEDEVADSVRDFACLEDVVPLVAILDLSEGAKFLLEDGVEVSTATVHNFVTRYTNDKLSSLPIRPVTSSATNTS
ncbi:nucleoredoxin-like [Homarus americanus]|uniref:nucleoredoxin-like n=1 Tax=Homarus americanus TaxID=6706 RepID=UPI001C464301|nr:nucleoredoxin-like [Homarus americanus]XP_042240517.1 nucleoredoxin-like [Homarus americanus]XP_042240518.1 nucleoredoxin-like [Homarus americanus]